MYFIPRNNIVYNYIAHTDAKRRYIATLFVFIAMIAAGFYGVYMPLKGHIVLSNAEKIGLQKQYEEVGGLENKSKELSLMIDTYKKNISVHAVAAAQKEEYCSGRMQYVFDTIKQSRLTLNSYGPCKEKDKKWYIKDSAPCQMTGAMEAILLFLKTIKESGYLITLSHLTVTRVKDNVFQLSCDVGIISVKS
jgi:Tfp pilus assembly protein PilO